MTNFALRIPDHIMEQAKAASLEDNISVNQMLASFIAEGLGHRRALKTMKDRAARADVDAALEILDIVAPDVPPDAGDELQAESRYSKSRR